VDDRSLLALIRDIVGIENTLDDCAVLPCGEALMVATTDMLHETTDFPAGMTDWQCGWMGVAVTLSDIASMGAAPKFILFAVGLDRWQRFRPIMVGAKACCDTFGGTIVGGDIDHHDELTIVTTGLGIVPEDNLVRRRGSRAGDLICVTGELGAAQAALDGYTQYWKQLVEPQPRVQEGQLLGMAGATSMMDISDGLALSFYDMLAANPEIGYSIETARLPLPQGIPGEQAVELALFGGGDYGLLFTIPEERYPVPGVDSHVIGTVVAEHAVLANGSILERRGYEHRWQ
jgi:thiamine-monophosphate kinase